MARRKKKPPPRIIHLSPGALPTRLVASVAGRCLAFSDASCLRQGGLAAVFYRSDTAPPQIVTRSVAVEGSNQLELRAALLAIEQAALLFPGQPLALFSDNRDTVDRLNRAKMLGLAQDPELAMLSPATGMFTVDTEIRWIPGHGNCRGNAEADHHARRAASRADSLA